MSPAPLRLPVLGTDPGASFPPGGSALHDPDGLLAMGGDLAPARLLNAYRHGIFPWFSEGQPILWWCPDPRMVFRTDRVRLSSRFRRTLRRSAWVARADTCFAEVIQACAQLPRAGQHGTWITQGMQDAYLALHRLGYAHSVEVFEGSRLVGGIYGVAIGRMFYGESMFSRESGGSKVALASLARRLHGWEWPLIDAQVENPHLVSLGAERWSRQEFLLQAGTLASTPSPAEPSPCQRWTARFGDMPATDLA